MVIIFTTIQIKPLLCPGTINYMCFVLTFIITLKYVKCDMSTFIYNNKFNHYTNRAKDQQMLSFK